MTKPSFSIRALTPCIGAEIDCLNLRALTDTDVSRIREAWSEHLVLFFRDQAMTCAELQAFARRFGDLHIHPQGDVDGYPGLLAIHTDKNSTHYSGRTWHSDVSCDVEPPAGSILHLHEVPVTGGDTLFANMYTAYEALSEPMQTFLAALQALHSGRPDYEGYYAMSASEMRDGKFPEAIHPVVRTHPETGRKALFVNEIFTQSIVGLSSQESQSVLGFLYRHIAEPRFQCRFHWLPNSVAMWDNRCVQHMALWDYFPQSRSGYRATLQGSVPF